jgi:hypothetical protein
MIVIDDVERVEEECEQIRALIPPRPTESS